MASTSSAAAAAYPETTDDESEDLFHYAPTPSQGPIMACISKRGGLTL